MGAMVLGLCDLVRGRSRLQKNLKQFGGRHGEWAYAESPFDRRDQIDLHFPVGDRSPPGSHSQKQCTPMWQRALANEAADQSRQKPTQRPDTLPRSLPKFSQCCVNTSCSFRGGVGLASIANTGQRSAQLRMLPQIKRQCSTPICFETRCCERRGYENRRWQANIRAKEKTWNVDENSSFTSLKTSRRISSLSTDSLRTTTAYSCAMIGSSGRHPIGRIAVSAKVPSLMRTGFDRPGGTLWRWQWSKQRANLRERRRFKQT